jgi:hypothetical protein
VAVPVLPFKDFVSRIMGKLIISFSYFWKLENGKEQEQEQEQEQELEEQELENGKKKKRKKI